MKLFEDLMPNQKDVKFRVLWCRAAEFKQAMSFYEALMRCRGNLAALHFSDGHHSYYATPIYLLYSVYTSHLVTHITLLLDTTALLVYATT